MKSYHPAGCYASYTKRYMQAKEHRAENQNPKEFRLKRECGIEWKELYSPFIKVAEIKIQASKKWQEIE